MDYQYDKSRYFDIPRYFYFEADNSTIGSSNTFNYRIAPKKTEPEGKGLGACVWYGVECYELSEPAAEKTFIMGEDGYKALIFWVDEQYEEYLEKLKRGEVAGRRTYSAT